MHFITPLQCVYLPDYTSSLGRDLMTVRSLAMAFFFEPAGTPPVCSMPAPFPMITTGEPERLTLGFEDQPPAPPVPALLPASTRAGGSGSLLGNSETMLGRRSCSTGPGKSST